MTESKKKEIVLETLDNLNRSYNCGRNNSSNLTHSGSVDPDRAYIETLREVLNLLRS